MGMIDREKHIEMLTLGLFLALTAPSAEKEKECVEIAESLAAGLTAAEVAQCQRAAQRKAGLEEDPVLVPI